MPHAIFTRPTHFQLAHAQTNFPAVALRCVRIFPGVNSRAELVTLAYGTLVGQKLRKSRAKLTIKI